jgi:hypothetical protein
MDCREENLMAMCPACHLAFDIDLNLRLRVENRCKQEIENGQLEIWEKKHG